jgi:hypothetical protein
LIAHILDAVCNLRDAPGLLRLLANATRNYHIGNSKRGRESHEIMGAVHEILRLGQLTMPEDPVDAINYVEDVFPPGKGSTPSGKEQIEIDGVLRSGAALEFKLATSGLKELDEKQKDQAQRYAQILKDGKISGVQYHITTPELGPKVIKFLVETIPGVRIFRYDSLITKSGQLNTHSEEIDTDLYLWDLDI